LFEGFHCLLRRLSTESFQKQWAGLNFRDSQSTGRTQMLQFTDQLIICHAPEHIENLGQVSLQVSGAAWPPMSHQPA